MQTLARLSARSVGTELPLLIRLSVRGLMISSSMSSRPSIAESMTSFVRCSKSSFVRYSKSSFVRCFVGVGGWAARSWLAASGLCAGQGPNGASRSIAQRLLRNGIGSGHEAYCREGFAHGGTGGRCGGRGSVSTCVAIGGSGECARQRFVPSRAHGFWLGGALFLVHPSVQKHLGDPSPSSSQGQRASDARTRVEVGDTAVVVGSRSLSSSKLHGRRPNPAEELRSAFGHWFCATNPVTCLADASLYQATNVERRFRPLGTAGAKMWSDDDWEQTDEPCPLAVRPSAPCRSVGRARRRPR